MTNALPNVGDVLAPVLARVAEGDRPLLIAIAERMAADRYRGWAAEPAYRAQADALRACAAREEDIARRIEGLYADAAARARDLVAANPDLAAINRTLFAGRPLPEQLAIQAAGERLGAATWRSFAKREDDPRRREVLLACAPLELASAEVLESILRTA
jgi:hypothetical protein